MKTLIEELEVVTATADVSSEESANLEYVERAKALGFAAIATEKPEKINRGVLPYPEITEEAIKKLLKRRIDEMLKAAIGEDHGCYFSKKEKYTPIPNFHCSGPYPQVAWLETPIEEYKGLPPRHVLTAFEKAKVSNVFERFAIVTVEEIKDPLLIGITVDNRRGLVDHWNSDISMDEILSLTDKPKE
jgi:hypothetical protein